MTYNRSLKALDPSICDPTKLNDVRLSKVWFAGAIGGLASWVVSAPSELIKCRTQLHDGSKINSLITLVRVWKSHRFHGLYLGGTTTLFRDSIGYGFYFSSYEFCRRLFASRRTTSESNAADLDVLVSGGIAGVFTWASVYPLDVIKTRIQAEGWSTETTQQSKSSEGRTLRMIKTIFNTEGSRAFYRGLTICSVRAFFVNAIQVFLRHCISYTAMLTSTSGTPMKR
jgi:solute carrier family 25 (mitochondrial carnitine/acylcarnitine transporter), member 20/29